jgi:imidazole glycerol phosphate synthase subunit HisF
LLIFYRSRMFRPRIIPVLLLKDKGIVKSIRFSKHRYIGDPINAVKLYNDLRADELVFLDILATREKRLISTEFIKSIGEEANMPFAVGGGIRTLADIRSIISGGAERVIINSEAVATRILSAMQLKPSALQPFQCALILKEEYWGKSRFTCKMPGTG